jgi:hypothetical protein
MWVLLTSDGLAVIRQRWLRGRRWVVTAVFVVDPKGTVKIAGHTSLGPPILTATGSNGQQTPQPRSHKK